MRCWRHSSLHVRTYRHFFAYATRCYHSPLFVLTTLEPRYACFVDSDCRQCLASLFTAAANHGSNGTKAAAFRSRACTATSPTLLNDMQNECGGQGSFPTCSSVKQSCTSLPECEVCLATFMAGNGAEAARQCHGATQPWALALQSVVDGCVVSGATTTQTAVRDSLVWATKKICVQWPPTGLPLPAKQPCRTFSSCCT